MSQISFATADRMYQCVASRHIEYHSVNHELFHNFWVASCQLKVTAASTAPNDELLRQLLRGIGVRFEFAATPLPFNHSVIMKRLEDVGFDAVARRVSLVYPSLAPLVSDVLRLLRELTRSEASPLLECLDGLVGTSGGGGVVIRDSRLIKPCLSVIESRTTLNQCEIVDVDELRSARTFHRIFLFGPTLWFPEHVFSAPRAPEIHVISYQALSYHWRPRRLFLGSSPFPAVSVSEHGSRQPLEDWPEPDWEEIARRALNGPSESGKHNHELTEARLFLLSGGLGVFLDVSNRSKSLVIDPEADGDARVRRVLSDEIQPGSFLLLRTEGGGDYIISLANQILGERAKVYREMQRHWKDRLREIMAESPEPEASLRLLDVSVRLIDLGAVHADEGNVRYWLSARSISPRELADFRAIMKLIGLGAETERYWGVMRQICAAHHHAGRRIRRSLIERVRAVDLSQFDRGGRFDIALPDREGGKLTAFLIEGRAPQRTFVPTSRDGRVFEPDN